MPRTYVEHMQQDPAMTDADDSIVLDDLVRTGEASRLRRRGAMRLDHNPGHAAGGAATSAEDDDNDELESEVSEPTPRRASIRSRTSRRHDEQQQAGETATVYTLFCGGDEPEPAYEPEVSSARFVPSLLPIPSSSSQRKSTAATTKKRRTNGCGAVIHLCATPRRRTSAAGYSWHGHADESETIVGLDACYFEETTRMRIQRSPCGCVREGIACAVCGNPLGTRYAPCPASTHSPLAHPRRPSYPTSHRHPRAPPPSTVYSYSFLPAAVTSSPPYTPPPPAPRHDTYIDPSSPQEPPSIQEPPSYPPLLDRLITASPTPLSDEEREAYRARPPPAAMPRYSYGYPYSYSYSYGPGSYGPGGYTTSSYAGPGYSSVYGTGGIYDADGELVSLDTNTPANVAEPGSPKAGEMVLLPER